MLNVFNAVVKNKETGVERAICTVAATIQEAWANFEKDYDKETYAVLNISIETDYSGVFFPIKRA